MQRYLLLGRTGVGKSSFVNRTIGRAVARTNTDLACTRKVSFHVRRTVFGRIALIDTPGLAEGSAEQDSEYLRLIRTAVRLEDVDAFLYLTPLHETRLLAEEMQTLRLLAEHIGSCVWRRGWLVLTNAAAIPAEGRAEWAFQRIKHIEEYLGELQLADCETDEKRRFRVRGLVDNVIEGWSQCALHLVPFLIHWGSRSHSKVFPELYAELHVPPKPVGWPARLPRTPRYDGSAAWLNAPLPLDE
jgi:GTP1/Obg family GTP-binding protein